MNVVYLVKLSYFSKFKSFLTTVMYLTYILTTMHSAEKMSKSKCTFIYITTSLNTLAWTTIIA